jgi:hypothetical protein
MQGAPSLVLDAPGLGLRAPSGPLIRDIRSHPTPKPYPKRQRGRCFTAGPLVAEYKFIKGNTQNSTV